MMNRIAIALLSASLGVLNASGYMLSMSNRHTFAAGTSVQVPVQIDDISGVASLHLKINYDPALLTISGVSAPIGTLGNDFTIAHNIDVGTVDIILVRDEALISGSGTLFFITGSMNSGGVPGLSSELVIAERELGGAFGENMALSSEVSHQNGKLWVVFGEGDTDGDGLSDYAEQMVNGSPDYDPLSGDTSVTNPDSDGDEMKDGWEFAYGLNPLLNDAGIDSDKDGHDNISEYIAGMNPTDSESVFSITYFDPSAGYIVEWPSVADRLYNVYRSTNLTAGFITLTNDLEYPANAYTDTLYSAESEGFYRVDVRLKPQS